MIRALYTAATGMEAQQLNIDVISNNLANVNTTGFKRSRADFQDLLYQTLRAPGAASSTETTIPTGIQVGLGSRPAAVQKLFTQGDFQQTGNEMDIVIEGNGFFQITQPGGAIAYTRAGAFKVNANGEIVNSDGYLLEPSVTIPSGTTKITIAQDGTITATVGGVPSQIGSISLARFVNPGGLDSIGRNLYLPTVASGDAVTGTPGQDGFGTIAQGFLEASNVNIVEELVGMIIAQRAYEINSKAIQASDEMLQTASNLRR